VSETRFKVGRWQPIASPSLVTPDNVTITGAGFAEDPIRIDPAGAAAAIAPFLPGTPMFFGVLPVVTPVAPGTDVAVAAGFVNQIATTNGDQNAVFPLAASFAGASMIIKNADTHGTISLVAGGSDTIDGETSWPSFLNSPGASIFAVSDGVSNWVLLLRPSG